MTRSSRTAPARGRLIGRHALDVLRAVIALLLLAFLAAWYVLETDVAAERVRQLIENRVTARTGQPTRIGRLELDVVPPRLELHDVLVGSPDAPLAAADRVLAEFDAIELIAGQITLENIELDRPTLDLDLPFGGPQDRSAPAGLDIRIHRARIIDGQFRIASATAGVAGEVFGVELQLDPEGVGRLGMGTGRGGGRLRVDSGELDLTGRNGSAALLTPLELSADYRVRPGVTDVDTARLYLGSSSVEASGEWRGTDNVDFQVQADVALEDLFRIWVPPGVQDHGGRADFTGTLQLRDGAAVLAGRVNAESARFMALDVASFSSNLQVRSGLVALRDLRAQIYGGEVEGELLVDSGAEPTQISTQFTADSIDAATFTDWEPLRGLRLAGALGGDGELSWSTPFLETVSGTGSFAVRLPDFRSAVRRAGDLDGSQLDAGELRATPALPLPGSIDLRYAVAGGTVDVSSASARLPGATIDLAGRVDLDGDIDVEATLGADDLRTIDQVVAQVREIAQGTASRYGLRGAASARLRLAGTVTDPVLTGEVSATEVAIADLRMGDIEADLTTIDGMLETRSLQLRRRDGIATGSARLRLPRRGGTSAGPDDLDYEVDLRLQSYGSSLDLEFAGPEWTTAGELSGDLRLAGRFAGSMTGSANLSGQDLQIASGTFDSIAFSGRKTVDEWVVDRLRLGADDGSVESTLRYRPVDQLLTAEARFDRFPFAALRSPGGVGTVLGGRLDGSIELRGPVAELNGDGTLGWTGATLDQVGLGAIALRMRATRGQVTTVLAAAPLELPPAPGLTSAPDRLQPPSAPDGGWAAAASFSAAFPYPLEAQLQSNAEVARTLLASLGRTLPADLELNGNVDLELSTALAEVEQLRGSGTITDLRVARGDFVATAPTVSASITASVVELAGAISAGGASAELTPRIDWEHRRLSGSIRGTLPANTIHLLDPAVTAAGTFDVDVELGGSFDAPRLLGEAQLHGVELDADWPYPLAIASAQLSADGPNLVLEEVDATLGEHPVRLSGTLSLDGLMGAATTSTVAMRVDEFDLGPFLDHAPAVQRLINGGNLSASVQLSGPGPDPRDWSGTLTVSQLGLRMQQYRVELAEPRTASVGGGMLRLADELRMVGGATDFGLRGELDLNTLAVDLQVAGAVGFEALNVLSPYWGTGGVADLDLRVYGEGANPAYEGFADLRDVVLSPPLLRQPVEDISARLDFDGRRIQISNVRGALGGGEVAGGGEIFLRDNFPQSFRLDVRVDNAVIRLEREVRFTASADLVHDGTPESSLLSGTVELTEALYRREYDSERALLDLLDAPQTEPNPFLDSINLAVALRGAESLFIDNNLADVEASIDMEARGTAARPVLLGRASVLSGGRLFWNGNNFDVLQGTVEFNNPFETEATFEVRSRTEIRRYTIDMRFSGSLARGVDFDYTSTPTLSDLELFNLLAFGEEPDSTTLQDPDRYQQALGLQATRYLTDAYFSEVESGAQRLFGVDRFRISPTLSGKETDATARVTLGKRINRNVYLTYSRLLNTSEDQLITVEYQVSPRLRIKGTRDEDGSFGIDFLVQQRIRR